MKIQLSNSKLQLQLLAAVLATASYAADLYLPVYSQSRGQSDAQLHIAELDPSTLGVVQQWDFPAAYIGHRAVCKLPNATNYRLFAGWTGGAKYDPSKGGQYGFSFVSVPPRTLGLSYGSADTATYGDYSPFFSTRIDLWSAGTTEITANNSTRESARQMDETSPVRVRVVRYRIDDEPISGMALDVYRVEQRVILDEIINPKERRTMTEGDYLSSTSLDIDWEHLYDDVVTNDVVKTFEYKIVKVEYLILLGYGPYTSWDNPSQTNRWLWASKKIVTRFFGENRVDPSPQPVVFSGAQTPKFSWTLDCPEREGYTAFRIKILNSSGSTLRATNIGQMPPNANIADPVHGRYSWTPPDSWTAYMTNNAASWSVEVYNSKFRHDSAITNTAAIIYTP